MPLYQDTGLPDLERRNGSQRVRRDPRLDAKNDTFALALIQRYPEIAKPLVPIKVVSLGHDLWSVGYYRIGIPSYFLNRMGLCQFVLRENIERGATLRESMLRMHKVVEEAQIVVMQRVSSPNELQFMESIQKRGKIAVVDTDDHLEAVDDLGPCLMTEWWHEGNRGPLYLEGLERADLITVAARNMKKRYEARWPGKVVCLPNPVDTRSSRWNFPHRKYPDTPLTIGWLAGPTHVRDGQLIAEPIKQILNEYPDVRYKSVGYHPGFIEDLPREQLIKAEPAPLEHFPALLDDVDISLVPMLNHDFNLIGKTDAKGFESVMAGCAVIASPVGEYLRWIEGESILFAKDEQSWLDSLRLLIEDPDRIREMQKKALKYVLRYRAADAVVPRWFEAYRRAVISGPKRSGADDQSGSR